MSGGGHPLPFSGEEWAGWERIRRYAVPRWMIERATERRLAGDWRGACAAANVDVAIDPAAVARVHGAETARRLDDDLRHLAPDLLRWNLPRVRGGRTTIATGLALVLRGYGEHGDGRPRPVLQVLTPIAVDGKQRLLLRFGTDGPKVAPGAHGSTVPRTEQDWTGAPFLWDARHSAELLAHCGGGDRAPFLRADGMPLAAAELPSAAPASGAAAHSEWMVRLFEDGDAAAAFGAAGIDLEPAGDDARNVDLSRDAPWLNLPVLAREVERRANREGAGPLRIHLSWRHTVVVDAGSGATRPRARIMKVDYRDYTQPSPEYQWRRVPDLELLRAGRIAPERLHPLVRAALLPGSPAAQGPAGPPGPAPGGPVRVRCRNGEWHELRSRDGVLSMPHSGEEQERELALEAFGGAVSGCFAVQRAWTSGRGRLPRALRGERRELFLRAQHGDTPGVLGLLDAGMDPRTRNGRRQTLLHLLHLVDHDELLPRLLAAGVGLEDRDHCEATPLHVAVGSGASAALVGALLDAGARIDVVDEQEASMSDLISAFGRRDLTGLKERIDAEHPGIGNGYWEDRWNGLDGDEGDEA